MKVYKSNIKENKWYKKINWSMLILFAVISFLIPFIIFNVLTKGNTVGSVINISIYISLLVMLGLILNDLLENRDRIYFSDNKKISYIEIHDDKDGKIFTHKTYKKILDGKNPVEIHNNIKKYEGITKNMNQP